MGLVLTNLSASPPNPAHRVAIAQFIEHTSGVKADKRRRLRSLLSHPVLDHYPVLIRINSVIFGVL